MRLYVFGQKVNTLKKKKKKLFQSQSANKARSVLYNNDAQRLTLH